MDGNMIIVEWVDVMIGLGLIAVAIGLSYFQGFGIQRDLAVGTLRCVLQLVILGYVLVYIFEIKSMWITAGILLVMALIAAQTARGRIKRPYPGALVVLWISITLATFFAVAFVTVLTMHDPIALTPQYLIPLGGMMIGNSLNGLSLGAERFKSELESKRDRVECLLSMGATADRAAADCMRTAFTAAMIPTINALMVIGLIQIPGVMTGQVMAGVDPLIAARYQLIVMFMIVGGKVIALSLGLRLSVRRYFTQEHQLRGELI